MLVALDFDLDEPRSSLPALATAKTPGRCCTRCINNTSQNKVLMLADGGEGQRFLGQRVDFIRSVKMVGGKATAYVCANYVCQLPARDLKVMARLLQARP